MSNPVIELRYAGVGIDARFVVNGVDLTTSVAEVRIVAKAGDLAVVWARFVDPVLTTELGAGKWVRYEGADAPELEEAMA